MKDLMNCKIVNKHVASTLLNKNVLAPVVPGLPVFPVTLLYHQAELIIESVDIRNQSCTDIYAYCSLEYGMCPYCGSISNKIHSKYIRHMVDLPILGMTTTLHLEMRKFFCSNPACDKKTFAEQPGNEVFRYRRRTRRCESQVIRQGLSVSSKNAAYLLRTSGIPLCNTTVLRDIHRLSVPEYPDVSCICVDDWAFRKGQTYGSIIIDYQTSHPIDLLNGRDEVCFRKWLDTHRSVKLVSRDRSTDYSAAIKSTGRKVTEIADLFHLIKNISDKVTDTISANYADYKDAVGRKNKEYIGNTTLITYPIVKPIDVRMLKFLEVKKLQKEGIGRNAVAKLVGMDKETVGKYFKYDELPPKSIYTMNNYAEFDTYIKEQHMLGVSLYNILQDIRAKGFIGSKSSFYEHYYFLSGHRGRRSEGNTAIANNNTISNSVSKPMVLHPIHSIAACIKKVFLNRDLDEKEKEITDLMMSHFWFAEIYNAATSFYKMITGTDSLELIRWMKKYWKTKNRFLKNFIVGIKADFKAVKNTILSNITNGIAEGYVNKLKVVKRSMYGRAKINLLKRKMCLTHLFFN